MLTSERRVAPVTPMSYGKISMLIRGWQNGQHCSWYEIMDHKFQISWVVAHSQYCIQLPKMFNKKIKAG